MANGLELMLGAERGSGGEGLEVRVMSFNIRYGSADDGENRWSKRKELVYEVIRQEGSDFVGLQEGLAFQIKEIKKEVGGYEHVGVGRGQHHGLLGPFWDWLAAIREDYGGVSPFGSVRDFGDSPSEDHPTLPYS